MSAPRLGERALRTGRADASPFPYPQVASRTKSSRPPRQAAVPSSFAALNFGAFAPGARLGESHPRARSRSRVRTPRHQAPAGPPAIDAETEWMHLMAFSVPPLPPPPTEFTAAPIPAHAPMPVPVPGDGLGFYPGNPTDERLTYTLVPAPNVFGDRSARADAALDMSIDPLEFLYALDGLLHTPTQPQMQMPTRPMQNWGRSYPVHGPFQQPPPPPPHVMGNVHTPAQGAWAQGSWTQ